MKMGNLGVLGFGNMGKALVTGGIKTKVLSPKRIVVFDVDSEKMNQAKALGCKVAAHYADLIRKIDFLLIACKPQNISEVLQNLKMIWNQDILVISIVAGISISYIRESLGPKTRVVRAMPNTPVLVLSGATGMALGEGCTEMDVAFARKLFESVGVCAVVPEELINVVTALSGSGPAYFFYFLEQLVHSACMLGLPEEQAKTLIIHTFVGAGRLLVETGLSPEELRKQVTSKGGTTEAALQTFEELGLPKIVNGALNAAFRRALELGTDNKFVR